MPPTRISDLLPIGEGTGDPHAYQVFGLADGEQDSKAIADAVRSTMNRLMAVKAQTDTKLWTQAARLAQAAQRTLANPQQKAELDARFGIIAIDDQQDDDRKSTGAQPNASASDASTTGVSDPLAGVLPRKDPLAAVLPSADPLADLLPSSNPLPEAKSESTEPTSEPDPQPQALPPSQVSLMPGLFGTPAKEREDPTPSPANPSSAAPSPATPSPATPSPATPSPATPSPATPSLATPTAATPAAQSQSLPMPSPEAAVAAEPVSQPASSPAKPSLAPVVIQPKQDKRRRSSGGVLMLATFAFAMFGLVGVLGYFLMYGPGEVAITNTDGQITISAQPIQSTPRGDQGGRYGEPTGRSSNSSTGAVDRTADNDLIGDPGEVESDVDVQDWGDKDWGDKDWGDKDWGDKDWSDKDVKDQDVKDQDVNLQDWGDPPSTDDVPEMAPSMTPNRGDEPDPVSPSAPETQPMSADVASAADQTLEQIRAMIRQSKWNDLAQATQAATEMNMTAEQKLDAEAYRDLAALAVNYRNAIVRAAANLEEDAELEVTEDFRVQVVESAGERLVVRYAGKEKRLMPDEFPFPLAHKLASIELPPSPSTEAAKAAYQAIAPRSNQGYRSQSLDWLDQLEGTMDEIDISRIRRLIETLFDGDA